MQFSFIKKWAKEKKEEKEEKKEDNTLLRKIIEKKIKAVWQPHFLDELEIRRAIVWKKI